MPTVMLDSGPLGQITNPKQTPANTDCVKWYQGLIAAGVCVIVPEIIDYEVRRELLRADKTTGIRRLNGVISTIEYLPLTTDAMRQAASFWAQARQQGQPTAADDAIDVDVILAAQAVTLGAAGVIIATTNPKHLARFVAADIWQKIL